MSDASSLLFKVVKRLRLVENRTCADCNRALGDGSSAYCQLQFNVWICQQCAKVHVVHIGVDNLIAAMSTSWGQEDISEMCRVTNRSQNEVLERYCEGVEKPGPEGPEHLREVWIRCKYNYLFVIPFSTERGGKLPPIKPPKPKRLNRKSSSIGSSKFDTGAIMKKAVAEGLKTELPTRFADFFIHIGPRPYTKDELTGKMTNGKKLPSHCEDLFFKPTIRDRFPSKDYPDAPVPELAAPFVFPDGMRLEPKDKSPRITTFVLTDEHRVKIYGAALTFYELLEPSEVDVLLGAPGHQSEDWALVYCPRAVAIIGHYPFFHAYSEFLKDLFHSSLSSSPVPLERQVQYFLLETPLPPLGKVEVRLQLSNQTMLVSRPPINRLPMVDFSYRPLFACLSTESVLLVFRLLAAEFSLCFVGSNPSLLTPIQEAFLSFLFPMVWQGVYIPVLPRNMIDILEAPVPVVMGVDASYIEHVPLERRPNGMVFVDLDTNEVRLGGTLLNGLSLLDIAALHAEAESFEHMAMEARVEVLSFLKEPVPARQTKKLLTKLEAFASCVFFHDTSERLLKVAGLPFPGSEHLSPLKSYAMEAGSVVSKESATAAPAEGSGKGDIQAATRALKPLSKQHSADDPSGGGYSGGRSILDPCNNTAQSTLFSPWDKRDTFDASEIRRAFLRFFVSLFMENDDYYKSHGYSDGPTNGAGCSSKASGDGRASVFRASVLSSSGRRVSSAGRMMHYLRGKGGGATDDLSHGNTEAFFDRLKLTQMYSQFHDERATMPGLPEIRFFEESMKEKMNRSKMTFNKNHTPFLSDETDEVKEIYSPPLPSISGLREGSRFEYMRFPILSEVKLGPRREFKALVAGPEKCRKVHVDSALGRFVANRVASVTMTNGIAGVSLSQSSDESPVDRRTNLSDIDDGPSSGVSSQGKGQAENRFETILLQGRDRYHRFLQGLARCQATVRMRQCRLRFTRMMAGVVTIQRVYRGHRAYKESKGRRLLWWASLSESHVVKVQSAVRMFVKNMQFKRSVEMATKLQSMHRCIARYRKYKADKHRLSKLGALIRGHVLRNHSLGLRVQKIKEYRRVLPLLWRLSHTSYFYSTLFWSLNDQGDKAGFLDVAIFAEEVVRLYRITGLADAVRSLGGGGGGSKAAVTDALLLDEVPRSDAWKAIEASGGVSTGTDQIARALGGTYQKHIDARQNAMKTQREMIYRILKSSVPDAEKQVLYAAMLINGRGRFRKQALLDGLWADPRSPDNIRASVQVIRVARKYLLRELGDAIPLYMSPPQILSPNEIDDADVEREWGRQKRAERVNKASTEACRAAFLCLTREK